MKNYNSKLLLLSLAIMVLLSVNVFAAEVSELLTNKITLNAEDASVSTIISTMAKLSNCNIVLAMDTADKDEKAEEKKITIQLKEVPIEQALALVVKSIGLSYRLVGEKTFIVGEKARIEEEIGERTYVLTLNYVDVNKIVNALKIMPGESIAIEGQNAILVRANPQTFTEISKRIEEIDVPQKQIEIRCRLIEISVSESEKYGIDWSKLNHLTTILAEDAKSSSGTGLPYNFTDATGDTPYGDLSPFGQIPEDQYFQRLEDLSDVGHFSRQLTAFDVTIDWLLQNNAAKLLTDTRITALNGEEAEIHIGEVVPYIAEDNDKQIQVEREEVGIKLKVRPTVNSQGQITTKIEPEVSSVMELVGGYIPRTKVRRITSTVTVPDGQRILVGGLLSTTISTTVNRVPLLSAIPLIVKLFQNKVKLLEKTDLIIEITPHVVTFENINLNIDIDEELEKRLIKENISDDTQELEE
ncbi:MAG: hypothetical protein PF570_03930 [Candidatus Cloacimonetes bacterium]|jgi:type IV pilus assembly protein PilQ|nr:hypothetical protein [Candidatus Cloacimonadota bacterium]